MDEALYLEKDIRLFEQKALDAGISENVLMERAGFGSFEIIRQKYPDIRKIAVFCGGGNNGGDGYTLAKLLSQDRYAVSVYQTRAIEELPQPARLNAELLVDSEAQLFNIEDFDDTDVDLIVDALLGIGLKDAPSNSLCEIIKLINEAQIDVVSLDIPSGLNADTGMVLKDAVKADLTITFIGKKFGLYTLDGPDYCGEIVVDDLQIGEYVKDIKPCAYLMPQRISEPKLSIRKKNSYKSMYGHVLIVGGNEGMPGSVMLAAKACMRTGAGATTIAINPMYANNAVSGLLEAMIYGINNKEDLLNLLDRANVVVLGPGLGRDEWASFVFDTAIAAQLPLVVDADALRLLADNPQHDDNWVLTPHPGEAQALLNKPVLEIQKNRLAATDEIQKKYGGTVVLKGNGTVINSGNDEVYVCQNGNPGMATAGMGDVLSGIIAGLLAQGMKISEAAKTGVWLHAFAAEQTSKKDGERGLIASDLFPVIRRHIDFL